MIDSLPELVNSGIFASGRQVGFHSHPGAELVLLTHGRCSMEVDGRTLSGGGGTLFILPSGIEHSQDNEGFVRTVYCSFRRAVGFDDSPRTLDVRGDLWIRLWMGQLYRMRHDMSGGFDEAIPGILSFLTRRVEWLEARRGSARAQHPAVSLALEHVQRHLGDPADLESMAKSAGVSASHLCALFSKSLKRGPVATAIDVKMRYAERLLGDPYLTVKEVASRCGFDDPNYFSRLFRKRHGRPPGEYRRRLP